MTNLLANVLGGAGAIAYVGYLAFAIGKPALIVISIGCLALMAFALYQEGWNGKNSG
jgi:hypothetical protein